MSTTRRSTKFAALALGLALVAGACSSDEETSSVGGNVTTPGDGTESTEPSDVTEPDATDPDTSGTEPATSDSEPASGGEGGTLIWAHEQEPADMHLDDPENNLSITSWIRQSMWDGLFGITGETTFFPELLADTPEMVDNGDGTFTADFVLRDALSWSDGEPLTSADVEYTFNMVMATTDDGDDEDTDPDFVYLLGDRTGWDTVTEFAVTSDTEFSMTWSAFFAGWQSLLSEIHPAHVFPGTPAEAAALENDALREWQTADGTVLPSSGPMIFDNWERGVSMSLVRNDLYHGSVSPDVTNAGVAHVDGVQINFVTDTDAQVNALTANEAQIIYTQPQLQFEEFADNADFGVASLAGPTFEHWGFNLNNPHLKNAGVREAIAFALNKGEVMEGLYTPLFGDVLPAAGLGNTYWMSNQPTYEDHQTEAGYGAGDIASAQAALETAGYTAGADGIYEHPENGRLSLRVGTTGGNRLREIQEELIQAQMADAGIEITINNGEGGAYFGDQPFNEDHLACANSGGAEGDCNVWDITQFAWVGGPWPGGQSASYRTGAGNNTYGYANADFDALADECDATVDDDERNACYNELDRWVTTLEFDPEGGLFMLPLTQKPSFYAYSKTALSQAAVAPDANSAGPLVNVVDYQFAG